MGRLASAYGQTSRRFAMSCRISGTSSMGKSIAVWVATRMPRSGRGLIVGLRLVVIHDSADPRFIPALRKLLVAHAFFLRLRLKAGKASGPSSYAVMTKTEPG